MAKKKETDEYDDVSLVMINKGIEGPWQYHSNVFWWFLQFGDWSYRLRFSHPTRDHLAAAVEVTAQPSLPAIKQGQQQQEPITVRTWNNVGHQMINASQSPIMLYVQVLKVIQSETIVQLSALMWI
jgi:hypothetical protein